MMGQLATVLASTAAVAGAVRWAARARAEALRQRRRRAREASASSTIRTRLDYAGADIWIYVTSEVERKYRARSCRKEPWTVHWLERHVTPADVLYDIGANVGTFSLIAAVARDASVVAFEPGFANYARLCANLFLNDCHDKVLTVPLPLSDANRDVHLLYRGLEPGQSRHRIELSRISGSESISHHICAIRLDDAVLMFNLPLPTHMKIDVDGWELQVLRGAANTLRSPELRSVLIEVEWDSWDEAHSLLSQAGFHCVERFTREKGPIYGLFLRHEPGAATQPDDDRLVGVGVRR